MESLETYAALFERLSLTELSVEEGDRKLCLKKEPKPLAPGMAPALPAGIATQHDDRLSTPSKNTVTPAVYAGISLLFL